MRRSRGRRTDVRDGLGRETNQTIDSTWGAFLRDVFRWLDTQAHRKWSPLLSIDAKPRTDKALLRIKCHSHMGGFLA